MAEDPMQGGRRDYDSDSPMFDALEQRLLRALEKGMSDTRHELRDNFFAPLGVKVETILLQGRDTTVTLANLTADIAEMKPELIDHRNRLAALEKRDDEDHAVADAIDKARRQTEDNRRQTRTWGLTITGLIIAVFVPLSVAIITHLH